MDLGRKSIRKVRHGEWKKIEVVDLLTKMLADFKADPAGGPVYFLREEKRTAGFQWSERRSLAHAFLQFCRMRELAEGLGVECAQTTTESQVMLFLLTGHLRAENDTLLQQFLASADFDRVAGVVCNLERLAPVEKYFYKYLLAKNLYSREAVKQWSGGGDQSYGTKLLSNLKEVFREKHGFWGGAVPKFPTQVHTRVIPTSRNLMLNERPYEDFEERVTKKSLGIDIYRDLPAFKTTRKGMPTKVYKPVERKIFIEPEISRSDLNLNIEEMEAKENVRGILLPTVSYRDDKSEHKIVKIRKEFLDRGIHDENKSKITYRKNAATLLKEAATILKGEEEENKKILYLLDGSSNFLEYEKMIEERIKEEQELFKLKIERLHLEGKLTEQAAKLAKLRLKEESRERRKEFEEERKKLVEDMNRLRESERVKITALVGKVREVHDKVVSKKQYLKTKKREEVERLTKEIRMSLREAMAEKKKNLEKKVLIIKELRAFQAFKRTLQKCRRKGVLEEKKLGLLCEMSLEELEVRQRLMKRTIAEERAKRRQEIIAASLHRESLLNKAEEFIKQVRLSKQLSRTERKRELTHLEEIPFSFRRAVPVLYDKEKLYQEQAEEIKRHAKQERTKRKNDIAKSIQSFRKSNKKMDEALDQKIQTKQKTRNQVKKKFVSFSQVSRHGIRNNIFIRPHIKRTFSKRRFVHLLLSPSSKSSFGNELGNRTVSSTIMEKYIWEKFKSFISTNTKLKIPIAYEKLNLPPSEFYHKKKRRKTLSIQSIKPWRRKVTFKHKRTKVTKTQNEWKNRWEQFHEGYLQSRIISNFRTTYDPTYTKKIINSVRYYHSLFTKSKSEPQLKRANLIIKKNLNEIMKLKAKLEIISYEIRKAKERSDISLRKYFKEPHNLIPLKPIRKRRVEVFPSSFRPVLVAGNLRNYEERDIKLPIFALEDSEITETLIREPLKSEEPFTNIWVNEGDKKEVKKVSLAKPEKVKVTPKERCVEIKLPKSALRMTTVSLVSRTARLRRVTRRQLIPEWVQEVVADCGGVSLPWLKKLQRSLRHARAGSQADLADPRRKERAEGQDTLGQIGIAAYRWERHPHLSDEDSVHS